jgi:hypothetical protein
MGRVWSTYGRKERCLHGFGLEAWGKRPLGRARCRWEGNITLYLQEMGWGRGLNWIDLAQSRNRRQALVNAVMNLQVP